MFILLMCWKKPITTTHTYPIPLNFLSGGWTVPTVWVRKIVKVRGLVEGGVHLLLLDMVSDTLNAKAAVYAIKDCIFGMEGVKFGGFFFHGNLEKIARDGQVFFVLGGWIWWEGTAWAEVWKFGWGCWWGWGRSLWHMRFACTFHGFFLFGFMRRWGNLKEIVT